MAMSGSIDMELATVVVEKNILKPSITLQRAVQGGQVDVVHTWLQWLERNPELKEEVLNGTDESGNAAAHYAAKLNHTEILEVLICSGPEFNANIQNNEGQTPLHLACIGGQVHVVNLILQCTSAEVKNEVLVARDCHSNTPLHLAVHHSHKDIAVALLKSKKELVNLSDEHQQTPLHLATKLHWVDVIGLLLESGADIEAVDKQLHTPLMVAIVHGHMDAAVMLMDAKASTEKVDVQGRNIAHLAAEQENTALLERLKAETSLWTRCAADSSGNTPLHTAAQRGNLAAVKFLLEAQVPTDAKDREGQTPVHTAAKCGHVLVVQKLLYYRESAIDDKDKEGCTPLHLASQNGHRDVAEALLKLGASVDSKDNNRETSVHAAARACSYEIVKLFIDAGADVDPENINQLTPLSLALKSGADARLALALLKSGAKVTSEEQRELITTMPVVAEKTLNDCIEGTYGRTEQTEDYLLCLNFGLLEIRECKKEDHPLSLMVQHRRLELLKHPVVKNLIKYKWKKYGRYVYLSNLLFYAIFLTFLTSFALVVLDPLHPTCVQIFNGTFNGTEPDDCEGLTRSEYQFVLGSAIVVTLLTCFRINFELFQLLRLQYHYFKETINWIEITLYFCTLNFVWVFHTPCFCTQEEQWEAGTIAIFLGWIVLTLFMDKLPQAGLYVVMFVSIFKTFLKTIVLSMLLIISFALAFYMLFHVSGVVRAPFGSPIRSIVKTMTMTEGEFDFDVNFAQVPGESTPDIAYPFTSFLLWIIFLVLMSILLTNLLTGLAVDDVKAIQEDATLKRLELKVDFLLSIDGFRWRYKNFIPRMINEWLSTEDEITVWVHHDLSLWQKLQFFFLRSEHDLLASAEDFTTVLERSQKRRQAEKEQNEIFRSLNLQEQMKGTIDTLKRTVTDLSKENREMKQGLLEMKQAFLELCSHSRWQENIMSQIARKHDINPEAPERDSDII